MCDLCTRNKKVFTHEHEMYTDKELGEHMRHGDENKQGVATGFKGHPLCGFCGERFYDDDKLFEHCRSKHERCFICDRRDSRSPHYYRDYNALEEHFKKDHFICPDRECMEKKFVVFESDVDLKAHQLSEHGNSLPKDARRDARTVDMSNFDFRQSYQQQRRGEGSGRDQQRRRPDPNAEPLPVSSAQPLRRDELAFQRQMAINSAQSSQSRPNPPPASRPTASSSTQPSQASRRPPTQSMVDAMDSISISDLSSLTPEQRASLTRHGAVIERASNLLGNNPNKMATFRSYISNYNKGSMTSDQVISSFFSLFSETSKTALGTLVREVADLFDDKNKGETLRKSWQDWRAGNEDYPSLPSLGGMRGATTSSSGWAAAASATPTATQSNVNAAAQARHSTRVLKLKNSTRRGSVGSIMSLGSASNASTLDWTPSRQTAASSSASAFPALPSSSGAAGSSRASQPSWIGGTASSTPRAPAASSGARRTGGGAAPSTSSQEAFPALPAAPKPTTTIFGYGRGFVRRDIGNNRDTGFSWGAGGSGSNDAANTTEPEAEPSTGKGKKKKKQVLAQWG
ncbi:hypothetical protein B0T16DRAFT_409057 [Cercophora newfieldiana]|uniref:C2H2-type domain-containing protein n=1 Tax=Cercophora newfieldiana TaxID=92897 RepID=A0AA39YA75_9PEZI|nr:hypothetical protein B0T16DRAFT_409057 [Cercophora newfieldiana]